MEQKQSNNHVMLEHKNRLKTAPKVIEKERKGKPSDELINLIDSCLRTSVNYITSLKDVWRDIKECQERDGLTNEQVRELMNSAAKRMKYSPRMVQRILPLEYKDTHMSKIGKSGANVTNTAKKAQAVKTKQLQLVKDDYSHSRVNKSIVTALETTESVQDLIKRETSGIREELTKATEMVKYDQKIINEYKKKLDEKPQVAAGEIKFYLSDLERALIVFKASGKRQGIIVTENGEFKEFR